MYTFAKFSTKEKKENLDASFKQQVNPKKSHFIQFNPLASTAIFLTSKFLATPRQHHTIVLTNYNSSHLDCLLNSQLITETASTTWITQYVLWGKDELNKDSEPDSINTTH